MIFLVEVNKFYFITHPAYTVAVANKNHRRTPGAIKKFIEDEIMPVINQAKKEPNSAVVIIPTNVEDAKVDMESFLREQGKYPQGLSFARIRKLQGIENKLIKQAEEMLGKERLLVLHNLRSTFETTLALEHTLKRKKIKLKRPVDIEGYGSIRRWCARNYPSHAQDGLNLLGKLTVRERGTLPEHKQIKPRSKIRRLPK